MQSTFNCDHFLACFIFTPPAQVKRTLSLKVSELEVQLDSCRLQVEQSKEESERLRGELRQAQALLRVAEQGQEEAEERLCAERDGHTHTVQRLSSEVDQGSSHMAQMEKSLEQCQGGSVWKEGRHLSVMERWPGCVGCSEYMSPLLSFYHALLSLFCDLLLLLFLLLSSPPNISCFSSPFSSPPLNPITSPPLPLHLCSYLILLPSLSLSLSLKVSYRNICCGHRKKLYNRREWPNCIRRRCVE